jgi:hypothetical protein
MGMLTKTGACYCLQTIKNEGTPRYILDLKHSSGKFSLLKDELMTIQNYDML